MGKASKKTLEELHGAIAEYYLEMIGEGDELSSGTLNAINAFLKNNNVVAEEVDSSPLQNIHLKLQSLLETEES